MHSHDRTLLASMGFADPDRRERRHTLACQYLAEPETALRLWERVIPGATAPKPDLEAIEYRPLAAYTGQQPWAHLEGRWCQASHARQAIEVPITRDRGYLLGFWDLQLEAHGWTLITEKRMLREDEPKPPVFGEGWATVPGARPRVTLPPKQIDVGTKLYPCWYTVTKHLHIEVKARPVDVADIAKQIALYRTGTTGRSCPVVVVATCYPMPKPDRDTLASKDIQHVFLGAGFDAYCERRAAAPVEAQDDL